MHQSFSNVWNSDAISLDEFKSYMQCRTKREKLTGVVGSVGIGGSRPAPVLCCGSPPCCMAACAAAVAAMRAAIMTESGVLSPPPPQHTSAPTGCCCCWPIRYAIIIDVVAISCCCCWSDDCGGGGGGFSVAEAAAADCAQCNASMRRRRVRQSSRQVAPACSARSWKELYDSAPDELASESREVVPPRRVQDAAMEPRGACPKICEPPSTTFKIKECDLQRHTNEDIHSKKIQKLTFPTSLQLHSGRSGVKTRKRIDGEVLLTTAARTGTTDAFPIARVCR